jgi:alcohol dehydrogenase, propanol-preferring
MGTAHANGNGTMPAIQLRGWGSEPELVEVPRPHPGPGQVLVRVEAAGLCHSDLHLMHDWPEGTLPYELPFTLGHENAGTVVELGSGARGVEVGARVAIFSRWGCGACRNCLAGRDNCCLTAVAELGGHGGGVGFDGGLAPYMVVPSPRYLVPIGDLDPAQAASLTDAGVTPYHAIQRSRHQLRPGARTVVIGVGGIGHMAIQILRALAPVSIVAVDVREDARRLALEAGADVALPAEGLTAAELRAEVGGAGADLVLDCVAADATLALAAGALAIGGDLSYVGRGGGALPFAPGRVPFECNVVLPTWGTIPELHEVVAMARRGALRTEVEPLALDGVVEGYRRLRRGEVVGRAVASPN